MAPPTPADLERIEADLETAGRGGGKAAMRPAATLPATQHSGRGGRGRGGARPGGQGRQGHPGRLDLESDVVAEQCGASSFLPSRAADTPSTDKVKRVVEAKREKNRLSATVPESLSHDAAGIVAWPQYTIHEIFQNLGTAKDEIPPDVRAAVLTLWWDTEWAWLVNPPEWVTSNLFFMAIPAHTSNPSAAASLARANLNLVLARARGEKAGSAEEEVALSMATDSAAVTQGIEALLLGQLKAHAQSQAQLGGIMETMVQSLEAVERMMVAGRQERMVHMEDFNLTTANKIAQISSMLEKGGAGADAKTGLQMKPGGLDSKLPSRGSSSIYRGAGGSSASGSTTGGGQRVRQVVDYEDEPLED